MSDLYTHIRSLGDTLSTFAVRLQRDGVPTDLTGKVVKFGMYDSDGNTVVAFPAGTTSNVTVSGPLTGDVEYDFQAGDVDMADLFSGYFRVCNALGTECDTWPAKDKPIAITIFDPAAPIVEAPPGISLAEFAELAKAPRRTRTVEGMVEERPMSDLIAADQYLSTKNNPEAVPWGMKAARTKPPSTTSS